jgi:quinoprotein glucose dehydrogenase
MPTAETSIPRPRSGLLSLLAIILILAGLALLAGGVWLATLGGSLYYIFAGLGLLISGVLLMRRSPTALSLYAAVLLVSLAWALWEAGLSWWPLAARLDVLFVLGLLLFTPWVTRALLAPAPSVAGDSRAAANPRHQAPYAGGSAKLFLGGVLALSAVIAVVAGVRNTSDTEGAFPAAAASSSPAPALGEPGQNIPPGEWHAYGRSGYGQRFSPLAQLTTANVSGLKPAWEFRTGDMRGRPGDPVETTFEVTPLKIGNRLFFCTPHQSVIALDATTGKQIWRYEPKIQGDMALQHLTCRGLSYQPPDAATGAAGTDANAPVADTAASAQRSSGQAAQPTASATNSTSASCAAKLFMPTSDGRLIALNPETGAVCSSFGGGKGQIDLWANMPNVSPGAYYSTSPVVVTRKLLIVGGTVLDNVSTKEQSGVIRAYDINTGALVWNWDSANPDATTPIAAGQTYTPNSPNSWSIASVDEALGMVYLPIGNQPPDQWGGKRGANAEKFSSSVVALDLATGKVRWNFQTVHHDLWDYDVPSQPTLVNLQVNGATVPALVQPTKQGELFVLDRRTGTPILPVNEEASPQGAATGDHTAPSQPKSALSFDPPKLTERNMWGVTMFDQLYCRVALKRLRYEGRFTPPSLQGSLIYPGNFGVFNWGGVAVDPSRQIAFTTPTYLAFVSTLVPRTNEKSLMVQDKGPPHGMLPALNENFGAPFAIKLGPFTSPIGIPCQEPPWGYVAGADLSTGKVFWKHRNGTVRDLSPVPLPIKMGVPNLGGPLMTAGGIAFLSGTMDNFVRAYDVSNGKQLWEQRLPAGGQATPMTYTGADGRQFVLVAAGGHGSTGTKAGDYVLAYALPKQ